MERDNETIEHVEPAEPTRRRVRKVDWAKVLKILDENPGTMHLIGEFNQSVRSHINQGRYPYIDPSLYFAVTEKVVDAPRTRGLLYMMRKP